MRSTLFWKRKQTIRKRLTALVPLLFSMTAWGLSPPQWLHATDVMNHNVKAYVDVANLHRDSNDELLAWVLMNVTKEAAHRVIPDYAGREFKSIRYLYRINCKGERIGILSDAYFSDENAQGDPVSPQQEYPSPFLHYAAPGTLEAALISCACSAASEITK